MRKYVLAREAELTYLGDIAEPYVNEPSLSSSWASLFTFLPRDRRIEGSSKVTQGKRLKSSSSESVNVGNAKFRRRIRDRKEGGGGGWMDKYSRFADDVGWVWMGAWRRELKILYSQIARDNLAVVDTANICTRGSE
uniref:Uncharacterized protein n=1 Tax=Vespula pensylvanica TaxID=30213 RepID=A0A834JLZ2_VESPE|nr:hypothetical protein H0235_017754 [Vespula pensylvanica]